MGTAPFFYRDLRDRMSGRFVSVDGKDVIKTRLTPPHGYNAKRHLYGIRYIKEKGNAD